MFVGSEIAVQLIRSAGLVSSRSHPNLKKTLDKGGIEGQPAYRVQALACAVAQRATWLPKCLLGCESGNLKVGLYTPVVLGVWS
jgi:hypothetical protein